ncbi:DUF4058 family protein [Gemmata sp. G18]|uniref:DUF4058 family protein n=1 Tax=Gemmata palustris TaxID=2822762 RepID=A0ABS5BUY1_9BACT|nr:DUF4058 family protein [Gemmata palustris]MBP3957237.1 DUF4058 family protein [Gemmata palustris]
MPLLDHFHGPIAKAHEWETFHTRWGVALADDLNRRLPRRFLASAPMRLGPSVAADVAEREWLSESHETHGGESATGNGVALVTEVEVYAPPAPELVMPTTFPDEYRVEVRDTLKASRVIAVIELVSESNKKEANEREQFAAKCLSYLGKGIGLVVIDIVTSRHWNLHNELVRLAEHDDKFLMPDDPWIYATAYRPVRRNKEDLIDLWTWPLVVGTALPAVPLALKGYGCVRLDLEATYTEACARLRITE